MNITITRKIEFDAGHRVLGHEGRCRHLHGHRYTAEISVRAVELDSLGRVIDFNKIKELVGSWVDDNWDHNMILHPDDPLLQVWKAVYGMETGDNPQTHEWRDLVFGGREPFVLDSNPTAENMARVLFRVATELLSPSDIKVVRVRLYETPNCWADFDE